MRKRVIYMDYLSKNRYLCIHASAVFCTLMQKTYNYINEH